METRQSRKSQVKTDIGGSTSFPGLEIISLASMRTGVGFEEMGVSFQRSNNNNKNSNNKQAKRCATVQLQSSLKYTIRWAVIVG